MNAGAASNWQWQDDQTADILRDLQSFRFMTIRQGEVIWPQNNSGPQPTPRLDGQAWQYGQNLTTARYGWYPTDLVPQPPEQLLHESQRPRRADAPPAEPIPALRVIEDQRASEVNLSPDYSSEADNQSETSSDQEPAPHPTGQETALCGYCGCNPELARPGQTPHHFFCLMRRSDDQNRELTMSEPNPQKTMRKMKA